MRICIVLPCNIYTAPFFNKYVEILASNKYEFDLIYWNRAGIKEETHAKCSYSFNMKDKVNSGNFFKIYKYIKFSLFTKKILRENKYDRVLILGSYAGIMAQLALFMSNNYNNRYWLDIRDYTFENVEIYSKMMKVAIENSFATAVSSPGYKKFLPEWNYIQTHNVDFKNIQKIKSLEKVEHKKIRISFIGLVRYYDQNIKLLEAFKNSKEVILQYFGMNSDYLQEYCKLNNITNVEFHGRFEPSETPFFYSRTDVINNIYGNTGIELTTALSNKLYYAAGSNIPILVSQGTMMSDISTEFGFGYTVDLDDEKLAENIINWYKNLDIEQLNRGCENFMNQVVKDEKNFEKKLLDFLSNDGGLK